MPDVYKRQLLIERLEAPAHRLFLHAAVLAEQNGRILFRLEIQMCQQLTFTGGQQEFTHGQQRTYDFLHLLLIVHHIGPFHVVFQSSDI